MFGWYAYLWFPAVARGMLNFGSKEREENVHSAIIGLIRKGALVLTNSEEIHTGFCVGPPAELMWHALDAGICPLYYDTIDGRGIDVRNEVGLDVSHHARISQRGGEILFSLTSFFIG
ncbi:MAG: hypothetical protein DMG97_28960 [Acidobacteria bacterium]|nr:MAG: hypothetical protein DMG97_28960 [Acidobacteriota bacterium]